MAQPDEKNEIMEKIIEQIRTCYDPEIPVNVYDLGLIYNIGIKKKGRVNVEMTLTSPACPVAGILPGQVQSRVEQVKGVKKVTVELVWDPPWSPQLMSEEAKLELGMF